MGEGETHGVLFLDGKLEGYAAWGGVGDAELGEVNLDIKRDES